MEYKFLVVYWKDGEGSSQVFRSDTNDIAIVHEQFVGLFGDEYDVITIIEVPTMPETP